MSGPWSYPLSAVYEEDIALKRAYAAELILDPSKPLDAACRLFPDDRDLAIAISTAWGSSAQIKVYMRELGVTQGLKKYLPTKEEVAQEILQFARTEKAANVKLHSYKLYADIMGLIEKPGTNVSVNVAVNRVMRVPTQGSSWETTAKSQQALLVQDATKH